MKTKKSNLANEMNETFGFRVVENNNGLKEIFKVSSEDKCTTDYSMFSFDKANREIDPKNVETIMNSISRCDWGAWLPLCINRFGVIKDGQHTAIARAKLGLPIYYKVFPDSVLDDEFIMRINVIRRAWTTMNYVKSFEARNITQYVGFDAFQKKMKREFKGITNSSILALFFKHNSPNSIIKNFDRYKEIELNENRENCVEWLRFCKNNGIELYKTSHFVYALKDFISDKTYDEIAKTLLVVAREWEKWNKGFKKSYFKKLNAVYKERMIDMKSAL